MALEDIPPQDLTIGFLLSVVTQTRDSTYLMVAGYIWVLYDWLTTLDDEIEYVWMKPGGWKSKVLYSFVRYYGIALLTYDLIVVLNRWSPEFCHSYFFTLGGGGLALLFAVEGALQLRVYILYDRSPMIAIFNGLLFVIEMACMIAFFLMDTMKCHPVETPQGLTGCWSYSLGLTQTYTKYMFFFCFAFEACLSAQVAHAGWIGYRQTRSWGLLGILVRDSLAWFVVLACCMAWNAVAWTVASPSFILQGVPIFHSTATIGGSRLLLNLRSACYNPNRLGTAVTTIGVSTDGGIGKWAVGTIHLEEGTVTGSVGVWATPDEVDDEAVPKGEVEVPGAPTNHDRNGMEMRSLRALSFASARREPSPVERWIPDVSRLVSPISSPGHT